MTVAGTRKQGQTNRGAFDWRVPFEPRNPARHCFPVFLVRFAELPAQRRLFVEQDEDVSSGQHKDCVLQNVEGTKQRRFSHDDQRHTHVHRIAHVAVQRGRDQKLCWSDRRRSPQPAHREFPCAAEINRRSERKHSKPEPLQRSTRPMRKTVRQAIRNVASDRSRHENGEQSRIQDWDQSAWHGQRKPDHHEGHEVTRRNPVRNDFLRETPCPSW